MKMNRGRRSNLGVFLLIFQLFNVGIDRIPKVTLVTIVGQILIYVRAFPVPSLNQVCASVLSVWYREDYRRLVLATFFHADDWHLYFNMASFLWKGRLLEPQLGSTYFAVLIAIFGVLTNGLMLVINSLLEMYLHKAVYLTQCAVGFSGVIFALKVLLTHQSHDRALLLGFVPIPMRYAVWAELVLIQLITPNASFVGHLAGILVGLAFCKGPLKSLLDPFFLSPGPSHYRVRPASSENNAYSAYTAGLSEEEQLRAAMQASVEREEPPARRIYRQEPPARQMDREEPPARQMDREELRRRRLARYDS